MNADFKILLAATATLLLGLYMMLSPILNYRGRMKPWDQHLEL